MRRAFCGLRFVALVRAHSQLHRRVVSYMAYVVSLLTAKIGMERFPSAAARLFAQLR